MSRRIATFPAAGVEQARDPRRAATSRRGSTHPRDSCVDQSIAATARFPEGSLPAGHPKSRLHSAARPQPGSTTGKPSQRRQRQAVLAYQGLPDLRPQPETQGSLRSPNLSEDSRRRGANCWRLYREPLRPDIGSSPLSQSTSAICVFCGLVVARCARRARLCRGPDPESAPTLAAWLSYTYDSLNRLIAVATSGTSGVQWGDSYSYDGFGNLTSKVVTSHCG